MTAIVSYAIFLLYVLSTVNFVSDIVSQGVRTGKFRYMMQGGGGADCHVNQKFSEHYNK